MAGRTRRATRLRHNRCAAARHMATPSASPASTSPAATTGAARAELRHRRGPRNGCGPACSAASCCCRGRLWADRLARPRDCAGNEPAPVAQAPGGDSRRTGDRGAGARDGRQAGAAACGAARRPRRLDHAGARVYGDGPHCRRSGRVPKALALARRTPGLMADLADALAAQNNGELTGEPTQLVQRALAIDPGNLKALALSGSAAFDRRDYATAVRQWEQVAARCRPTALPRAGPFEHRAGAPARRLAAGRRNAVADASAAGRRQRRSPVPRPSALLHRHRPAHPPRSAQPCDQRHAQPCTRAAGQGRSDDTVFIVARPTEGRACRSRCCASRCGPAAAVHARRQHGDGADREDLRPPQVIVVARISKSGNAMPQAGDLSGQSKPALGCAGAADRDRSGGRGRRGAVRRRGVASIQAELRSMRPSSGLQRQVG